MSGAWLLALEALSCPTDDAEAPSAIDALARSRGAPPEEGAEGPEDFVSAYVSKRQHTAAYNTRRTEHTCDRLFLGLSKLAARC